jgi:hypothetical protein
MMKKARTVPLSTSADFHARGRSHSRNAQTNEEESGLDDPYFDHKRHGESEENRPAMMSAATISNMIAD